jgi:uncharacterized membrane protein YbhN (UPF0104 family)
VGFGILLAGWQFGVLPSLPALPAPVRDLASSPWLLAGLALVGAAAVWFVVRHVGPRVRRIGGQLRSGFSVLRTPGRYARTVLLPQSLAWTCRIGIAFCLLQAFDIHASVPLAALVVVACGMSTAVPVPGGAGSQQALAVFVLASVATTADALSFGVGMQVAVTLVNTLVGLAAAMVLFGRLHPLHALREAAAAASLRPAADPAP